MSFNWMSIVDVSSGPVFVVIACDVAKRIDCSSSHDNGWPCLDIYFELAFVAQSVVG